MKEKPITSQVVIAHNVLSGAVVYLTRGAEWSTDVNQAVIAQSGEAASTLLASARPFEAFNEVLGLELIDVTRNCDTIVPMRLRERIRAAGPTISYLSSNVANAAKSVV